MRISLHARLAIFQTQDIKFLLKGYIVGKMFFNKIFFLLQLLSREE